MATTTISGLLMRAMRGGPTTMKFPTKNRTMIMIPTTNHPTTNHPTKTPHMTTTHHATMATMMMMATIPSTKTATMTATTTIATTTDTTIATKTNMTTAALMRMDTTITDIVEMDGMKNTTIMSWNYNFSQIPSWPNFRP